MVGWKSRDKKNQKKSSTSIRIHLADLSQHPGCQKQRRAGGEREAGRDKHSEWESTDEGGSKDRERPKGREGGGERQSEKRQTIEGTGWGQRRGGPKAKKTPGETKTPKQDERSERRSFGEREWEASRTLGNGLPLLTSPRPWGILPVSQSF